MAKCVVCNSRKGKRQCKAENGSICSVCCGEIRTKEKCCECSFFSGQVLTGGSLPSRNYRRVPCFPVKVLADRHDLQDYANVIESAICQFDSKVNGILDDITAKRIVELLLDKYHFNDSEMKFVPPTEKNGLRLVDKAIQRDLDNLSEEVLTKVLGTIYRSIERHTNGNREYIEFINTHVGVRVGKGIRYLPSFRRK